MITKISIVRTSVVLVAAYALTVTDAFSQAESTTDPVGLIELPISGGSPASPKLSLVSPTLTRPVSWQGSITAISGTTISVDGAPWTAGQFNGSNGVYYVEVISATDATKSGALSDISATTASTVTTADDLTSPTIFAKVGDTIKIRKHVTISDVFGATNSAGLQGSFDASLADQILVYNGDTPTEYWYYDGSYGGTAGWYDLNFNPSGSVPIGPNEGVVVRRIAAGDLRITVAGAVKTGNTLVPVRNGLNVLGTASAKGLTLASSGLVNGTSGLAGSYDASLADEVIIYSPTAQTNYWYYDGSYGGAAGWYDLNFNPSGAVSIAPGSAIVVNRKGRPAFNWPLPSPSSF
jgi:uncharacterized protein (TIGR02597 family)